MRLGVLTGLAREADCLPGQTSDMIIACAGASPERAERLSLDLVEQGCRALLSFGIAGALDPSLKVGDIVVASGVIGATNDVRATSDSWRNGVISILSDQVRSVSEGLIYGSDTAIASAREKSEIHQKTGALCVDMETHRLARVALETSTPFLVIRVISDDANQTIPTAALGVIGIDGKPQIGRVLSRVLRSPWQIPALIQLSKDMETAIVQLRRVPALLGPLFRFT